MADSDIIKAAGSRADEEEKREIERLQRVFASLKERHCRRKRACHKSVQTKLTCVPNQCPDSDNEMESCNCGCEEEPPKCKPRRRTCFLKTDMENFNNCGCEDQELKSRTRSRAKAYPKRRNRRSCR